MAVPQAAEAHYAEQQRLNAAAVALAVAAWSQLDEDNLDTSWRALLRRLFAGIAVTQRAAAAGADRYLTLVNRELGLDARRVASVRPQAFAGIASDGRPLESLLVEPIITVKEQLTRGATVPEAMRSGERALRLITETQVQDAGRVAVGVSIVAHPELTGWVRMLNPPSCARCVILAGKFFQWSEGFERHPMCDCRHIPASEALMGDLIVRPMDYFNGLSEEDQNRYFTKAGAEAIRDGADIFRVVNMRGVDRAGRRRPSARPMPEAIYEAADGDRGEALRLLRLHGYIV